MPRLLAPVLLVLLAGCASSSGVVAGRDFVLAPGTRAVLPDAATLHYLGIANDSRCPPAVHCIRAGDADVLFDVVAAGQPAARVLLNTERRRAADLGAWRLELVDLAPGALPRATLRLEARRERAAP